MKAEDAILELGARFGIESPHTEHVTRLALDLFDGFSPLGGLEQSDRNLLFAAAQLHDIAYAADPPNHVVEGARLLFENPIDAFSSDDWLSVIGIALLHKRDWRGMLDHELFPGIGARQLEVVKKLGAILRIADGLDHGHIQDAKIIGCRRGKKVDKLRVECKWYGGNVPWAEGKADLWESVFKRGFRVEGKLKPHKKLFKGVVHKKDSAISAARRLLYSQWCIMRDNVPGMMEGNDLECLHDYRVALRRFRAALRFFRPILGETSAHDLDGCLDELSDRLGSVRDDHISLQFVESMESADSHFPEIIQSLKTGVEKSNQTVRVILESEHCLQTVQLASRFLRVELPAVEKQSPVPPYSVFAQEGLNPLLERILDQKVSGLQEADPARMHAFRKLCRRGRYVAEFASPVLDKRIQHAANHLKTIAGALGDIRDGRMLAARFDDGAFVEAIQQQEEQSWARFDMGWRKLCEI